MGQGFEIADGLIARFFYASQLAALLFVLLFVVFPLQGVASLLSAFFIAVLTIVVAVGLWRKKTDRDGGTFLGTSEDITYDPFADPGHTAKDRWEKAVRRLPGGDDERD